MDSSDREKKSSAPKRPDPEAWGYAPGYFGGARETPPEGTVPEASTQRRRKRRHTTFHQRTEEASVFTRNFSVGLVLVAIAYVVILGFITIAPKFFKKSASPSAEELLVSSEVVSVTSNAEEIKRLILSLKRSSALAEEGRRLMRARQLSAAERKFQEADTLTPGVPDVLTAWGSVLRDQKKWPEARDVLVRALRASPDAAPTRLALAAVFNELQQQDEAVAMAEWVLEKEPYTELAHQIVAEISVARNQHAKAVEHWKKLAALNSNNYAAKNSLGASLLVLGLHEQAQKTFDEVILSDPSNSQAFYYKTLCLIQKNELESAVELLSRAVDRFGFVFVKAWTTSKEFEPVRDLPSFNVVFADPVESTQGDDGGDVAEELTLDPASN